MAGKAVKVILPLAGEVLFSSKSSVSERNTFYICHKRRGLPSLAPFVWLSIRLFILVWLGDGFPTVIRSVFRLSVGRFPALMRGGFPSVSWSENCTTGIGGTFTYRRLAAEKPSVCVPTARQRPVRSVRPLWWCSLYPAFPLSLRGG